MIRSVSPEQSADVLTIQSVVTRLMHSSDYGDLDEYMEYYTEDATWTRAASGEHLEGRGPILESRRQMRAFKDDHDAHDSYHMLTNILVDIADDGDHATCNSYMFVFKQCRTTPAVGVIARYEDQFRRTPHGWKLASRVVHEHTQPS